jgi:enoyl-CoA hydratase/carnithine racemase
MDPEMSKPASTSAGLKSELRDGVLHIAIDNPTRLNAFTTAMWTALPELIRAAEADSAVRVIVLKGAGDKAFSAGADISEFEQTRTAASAADYDRLNNVAFETLAASSKPTIAMINGFCLGGGLEVALCCDLQVASSVSRSRCPPPSSASATTSAGCARCWPWSRLPAPGATVHRPPLLRRRGGRNGPRQLGGGAGRLRGRDARPCDRDSRQCAAVDPRRQALRRRPRPEPGLADLSALDALVDACFASADYVEGRRAFMEKRKPVIQGPLTAQGRPRDHDRNAIIRSLASAGVSKCANGLRPRRIRG